jgi:hypothetical protein
MQGTLGIAFLTVPLGIARADAASHERHAPWVLCNLPASVTSLAENVPKDSAMPATPAGSQQRSIGPG